MNKSTQVVVTIKVNEEEIRRIADDQTSEIEEVVRNEMTWVAGVRVVGISKALASNISETELIDRITTQAYINKIALEHEHIVEIAHNVNTSSKLSNCLDNLIYEELKKFELPTKYIQFNANLNESQAMRVYDFLNNLGCDWASADVDEVDHLAAIGI